jgi:hypothetical protein
VSLPLLPCLTALLQQYACIADISCCCHHFLVIFLPQWLRLLSKL